MASVIKVKGLTKSYKEKVILNNLDLDIEQGSIVGLLGKNGAGKSTLIHSILGINNYQQGEIKVYQEDSQKLSAEVKEKIGFVAQTPDEFNWMMVSELLQFKAVFYKKWNHDWVERYIDKWQLDPKQKVGDLSQGQLQRLAIIMALAHEPELLIFDEPVSALDPAGRRDFLKELIEISSEGNRTILFSTHITSDLERVASHIAILGEGEIKLYDSLDNVKDNVRTLVINSVKESVSKLKVPYEIKRNDDTRSLKITVSKIDRQWLASVEQQGIEVKEYPLSLEDTFLELT